jgi:hypothetical protein
VRGVAAGGVGGERRWCDGPHGGASSTSLSALDRHVDRGGDCGHARCHGWCHVQASLCHCASAVAGAVCPLRERGERETETEGPPHTAVSLLVVRVGALTVETEGRARNPLQESRWFCNREMYRSSVSSLS